jgi:hypothetical protein
MQQNWDSIEVHIQWGPREEGLEVCTKKAIETFAMLASISPVFAHWMKSPRSRQKKIVPKPLDLNLKSVAKELILSGQHKTDIKPRMVLTDLGYSFLVWNLEADQVHAFCTFGCNGHSKLSTNGVCLSIKRDPQREIKPVQMIRCLKELIVIWDAEIGVIRHSTQGQTPDEDTFQLVYYARPNAEKHPVWHPVGKIIEEINGGSLWLDENVIERFETWSFDPPKRNLFQKMRLKIGI